MTQKIENGDFPAVDINSPKISFVDINMGNKCNLKCLMCFPTRSNQIAEEHGWKNPDIYIDESIYDEIIDNAQNIRDLRFTGGEPLLHDKLYEILDYMIENNHSKNIELRLNTNLTVTRHDFFDKLPHFKKSIINASLEACGKRNEYIRFPSKWAVLEKNIQYFNDRMPSNGKLIVSSVFQNLNVAVS